MVVHDDAIYISRQVSIHRENTGAVAGYRHSHHQGPIADQQAGRHDSSRDASCVEDEHRSDQVNDGDSLQDSGNANGVQIEFPVGVKKESDNENDGTALQRVEKKFLLRVAASYARSE